MIDNHTLVQLTKSLRRTGYDLTLRTDDGRKDGTVSYTLHVDDSGGMKYRILSIDTDDENYELVSNDEWAEIQERNEPGNEAYITEGMAIAFGFMPKLAREVLQERWAAVCCLVIPSNL